MRFEQITVRDGLPENSVVQILQDYQGFLWLATQIGLVKYDGYRFTVYNFDPSDSHSIGGRIIFSLYEDKSKNIWIGTEFGLSKYDRENNWFENYSLYSNIEYDYFSIGEDDYGNLYFGSSNGRGLYKFDKANKSYLLLKHNSSDKNSISSNFIRSILKEDSASILIGTIGGGLNKFEIKTQIFKSYKNIPDNPNSISSNNVYSILKDRLGNIWIGTDKGLNKFNKLTETFTVLGISTGDFVDLKGYQIPSMNEDIFGNLWLAVYDFGLVKFEPSIGRFTKCEHDPHKTYTLHGNTISSVFMDVSGVLWAGYNWEGLYKYDPLKSQFLNFANNAGENRTEFVNAILEDSSGTIWVGTLDGLKKIDLRTNTAIDFGKIIGNKEKLSSNIINRLLIDSYGYFWIGTPDGLNKYDKKKGSISIYKHIEGNKNSISGNDIRQIYEDRKGNLWIATMNGLNIFDRKNETFKAYYHSENDSNSISQNEIFSIYEDSFGNFWIGTNGAGLNKFDCEKQTFTHYFYPKLGFFSIYPILEDKKGRLWMGSYFTGLNLFDRNTGKIRCISEKDGLINNSVYKIIVDDSGNLWIGTDNGLSRFNPETNEIKNFDKNVLPITRFLKAGIKDEKGYIYLGGEGGFIKFHPDSIKDNEHIPNIVLTDFLVFNKTVKPGENSPLKKNINVADEINLTYEQNQFSFEFAALDYHNPIKNRYAYMLEGFDKDWIYSGNVRTANYTNIDPGEYIFHIKGSNNDGIWNEKGTSIRIVITPPWWQRLWFRIGSVLLLAFIFGGTIRFVSIQKLKRKLGLEKERLRISNDMHDEVGSSLTRITLLSEIANRKLGNIEEIRRISDASRHVVNSMDEIVWAVNPKYDTLDNLAAYILQYAQEFFEVTHISCRFDYPGSIPHKAISSETRHNVFLVIKEALNNIVKHSGASEVTLKLALYQSSFQFDITDNGKGFDKETRDQFSNGINSMQDRISEINGKIEFISGKDEGTKVTISVPE